MSSIKIMSEKEKPTGTDNADAGGFLIEFDLVCVCLSVSFNLMVTNRPVMII